MVRSDQRAGIGRKFSWPESLERRSLVCHLSWSAKALLPVLSFGLAPAGKQVSITSWSGSVKRTMNTVDNR